MSETVGEEGVQVMVEAAIWDRTYHYQVTIFFDLQ